MPWDAFFTQLQASINGPVGTAAVLCGIVLGGAKFATGEGNGRVIAGIAFGGGLVLGATRIMSMFH
jgi:type IV secretory pathway VirB2 component (pilin)